MVNEIKIAIETIWGIYNQQRFEEGLKLIDELRSQKIWQNYEEAQLLFLEAVGCGGLGDIKREMEIYNDIQKIVQLRCKGPTVKQF